MLYTRQRRRRVLLYPFPNLLQKYRLWVQKELPRLRPLSWWQRLVPWSSTSVDTRCLLFASKCQVVCSSSTHKCSLLLGSLIQIVLELASGIPKVLPEEWNLVKLLIMSDGGILHIAFCYHYHALVSSGSEQDVSFHVLGTKHIFFRLWKQDRFQLLFVRH